MFLQSRLAVVDDRAEHLSGLKEILNSLNLDCHSKLYDEETVADWEPLPGVRIIFIDKNLRTGVTMGGGEQNAFAAIVEVLEKLVDPSSGPYGLVLWAEQPQLEELKTFLFERLGEDRPELLPVFCEQLRKTDYINTGTGAVVDAEKLKVDIVAKMSASPQMKALFSWEADVAAAMDAVLRSLVDLVPMENRKLDEFGGHLGNVLYRLSQAGSGHGREEENPRESINRVLVPILADRITEHDPEGAGGGDWSAAIVKPNDAWAELSVQAKINSAIHISRASSPQSIQIKPSDLGAVVAFPFADIDKALEEQFQLSIDKIKNDLFFGASDEEWDNCHLRLVQIGASCDHAQQKDGPILYLLAIEWPFTNADGSKTDNAKLHARKTRKEVEWRTPVLVVGDKSTPGKVSVFLNCPLSVPRSSVGEWQPVSRFREELVSHLTQEYARHISRPGIVTLSRDD